MSGLLVILLIALAMSLVAPFSILFLIALIPYLIWKLYESRYFKGKKFAAIKGRIQSYIDDCNALNRHISELKNVRLGTDQLSSGRSEYRDASKWNFRRPELRGQQYGSNIYNCSRTVCDGARRDPFKYVCKYFSVAADEKTLEHFETILNNFEAAEEGKKALREEKEKIIESIQKDIPSLIRKFSQNKVVSNLGFDEMSLNAIGFPKYVFKYISPGGNSSTQCDVVMDITNLNRFVVYLSEKIKFKKSVAGQRALMTSKLRQKIKERDGFKCKRCGASVSREPNLLLEIDHIIPLSRGGMTTESNLQTLCWRCNRSKGAKM